MTVKDANYDTSAESAKTLMDARDMPLRLFHLTPLGNIRGIKARGLRSDDGQIFVYTHPLVAPRIATKQVFCRAYGVFEIDLGLLYGEADDDEDDTLYRDNVGEFSAAWQWIIRRKHIPPEYLTFIGRFRVRASDPDHFERWVYTQVFGMSGEDYDAMQHKIRKMIRDSKRKEQEELKRELG
jgi:hypothetical protein